LDDQLLYSSDEEIAAVDKKDTTSFSATIAATTVQVTILSNFLLEYFTYNIPIR